MNNKPTTLQPSHKMDIWQAAALAHANGVSDWYAIYSHGWSGGEYSAVERKAFFIGTYEQGLQFLSDTATQAQELTLLMASLEEVLQHVDLETQTTR